MIDLEQRLADALTEGAQGAPSVPGLAAAARSRARARRRNRLVGVAAVVALAVAVPTAVVATHDSDAEHRNQDGTANDPDAVGPSVRGGYHYESWHDVTIEVPDTWVYGTLNQWCADGGLPDESIVERPGGMQTLMLCTPASSYGVSFAAADGGKVDWPVAEQHSDAWPDGAFVGATTLGDVVVTVAAPEVEVALELLGSAQRNEALDPNGCPVDADSDPVVPGETMTVCRYDTTGKLEQSELLSGADLKAAELALRAAPAATATDCDALAAQTIRLASVAEDAGIDLSCGTLMVHGEARRLTADVLYWALSPGWSGSVPDGVSLPSELRSP